MDNRLNSEAPSSAPRGVSEETMETNKIKELDLVPAERLRADTLQKELEEFKPEVKEKASQDVKQVQNLEVEIFSLEQEVQALKEEILRRDSEETNKIQELQDLVQHKDDQLQAERLRADTLQKEEEDFRREVQEKASRDLEEFQNLVAEKVSLEQQVGNLQEEVSRREAVATGISNTFREIRADLQSAKDANEVFTQKRDIDRAQTLEISQALQERTRRRMTTLEEEASTWESNDINNISMIQELEECARALETQLQAAKAPSSAPRGVSEETMETNKIKELDLVQAERLRADTLQKELEEFKPEVKESVSQDVKQVQNQEVEKVSLEQEVKALQEEIPRRASKETNNTNKIQELQDLVQHKDDQLQADRLDQEGVSQALPEEVEQLQEEIKTLKPEKEAEPSLTSDNVQVDCEGDTPNIVQETSETTQTAPEVVEDISLWRRFKKFMTPHSRRQYKHLRWQKQDQE
ncbi:ELKS/Rab6-interacting/CAST family member 1-like [Notolabrus celidotus]|uniref:ELKS/Rab6-interacting/CAST family member 1-like n=1 Tax=Notolabrus celidotus TaxID=1203425 RepID=UPI00148F92F6|nr:ELKS/Rab6-interacting/CAST family member 1-like [Notolabrus celidotus]